jgi:hypothetical protein
MWSRKGNQIMEIASKTLKNDTTLVFLFREASRYSKLNDDLKEKLMIELTMKVLHARAAAEHNKLKEQKTNREAKGAVSSTLRGELKVLGKKRRGVANETMVETDRQKNTETNGGDKKRKKYTTTKQPTGPNMDQMS